VNLPERGESTLRSGAYKAVSDVSIFATVRDYTPAAASAATQCGCRLAVATGHAIEFVDR
jgi:hypothetical protein